MDSEYNIIHLQAYFIFRCPWWCAIYMSVETDTRPRERRFWLCGKPTQRGWRMRFNPPELSGEATRQEVLNAADYYRRIA